MQISTISLQTEYDMKLTAATNDAIKAFQINTANSSTSDIANSKIRDIEASVSVFKASIKSVFGMNGYSEDEMNEYIPALVYTMYDGFYIYSKFNNQNNYLSHYQTAKELIRDLNNIDILIAGVGTGGTITGIAKYFKENNINTKIVAVEPAESSVLSNNKPGSHKIQGIGAGFIPSILDLSLIDEIVTVSYLECVEEMHIFSKTEGLLIGISSGAVLAALRKLNIGNKKVAVIFPDLGYKYFSSDIYK